MRRRASLTVRPCVVATTPGKYRPADEWPVSREIPTLRPKLAIIAFIVDRSVVQKGGPFSIESLVAVGDLLDILDHPNPERYSGQRIFVVRREDYVYLVPFVEDEHTVFLKTIIPSRKATKEYLGEESDHEA
jgi:hypothetical protein